MAVPALLFLVWLVLQARGVQGHISMVCSSTHKDETNLTTFFLGTYAHQAGIDPTGQLEITPPSGEKRSYSFTDVCAGAVGSAWSVSRVHDVLANSTTNYSTALACSLKRNSLNNKLVRDDSLVACYVNHTNPPDPSQEWAIAAYGDTQPYCLGSYTYAIRTWWYAEVDETLPGKFMLEAVNASVQLQPGQVPPCSMESSTDRFNLGIPGAPVWMEVSVATEGTNCETEVPTSSLTNAATATPTPCDGSVEGSNIISGYVCPIVCDPGYTALGQLTCNNGEWDDASFSCTGSATCSLPEAGVNMDDKLDQVNIIGITTSPTCSTQTEEDVECAHTCTTGYDASGLIKCGSDSKWGPGTGYAGCVSRTPTTWSPTSESPSSDAPSTMNPTSFNPTTDSPTSESPTTPNPSTKSPTTDSPTTWNPTSYHPTSDSPTSESPTTKGPTQTPLTESPTSCGPSTESPISDSPTTDSPTSTSPTSCGPTSGSPTSDSPTTFSPSSLNPTTDSPTSESPSSYNPTSYNPSTHSPTSKSPVTIHPLTVHPFTVHPYTFSPTTLSPSTSGPTTDSPTSESPSSYNPTSYNPSTHSPTSKSPVTIHPLTVHPFTVHPYTFSPTTLSPSTSGPTTHSPTSESPSSLSPTTQSPHTAEPSTSPSSRNPTTYSPTTLSPTTRHPLTTHPHTGSPSTCSPTTRSPESIAPSNCPLTQFPTSTHPITSNPTSGSPSTASPSSASPTTVSPETSHPTSCTPTTWSPTTSNPTTSEPTTSPLTSSPTKIPVTVSPTFTTCPTSTPSVSPATAAPSASPATAQPTQTPVTQAPTTANPTSNAPTFSPIAITSIYIDREDAVEIAEDFPEWDTGSELTGSGTGRFFVQNTAPDTTTITITCVGVGDNAHLFRVEPEVFSSDGSSSTLSVGSSVSLTGQDPTHWSCETLANQSTVIQCNGQTSRVVELGESFSASEHCNLASLVGFGAYESEEYACPHPCWDSPGGCASTGGATYSVGVFRVTSEWSGADNNGASATHGSIQCRASSHDGQKTNFSVPLVIENTVWPIVADFFVKKSVNATPSPSLQYPGPALVVTLSGETEITAVGDASWSGPKFSYSSHNLSSTQDCPNVTIGGVPCKVTACTADNVTFTSPKFSQICVSGSECGYVSIEVSNPAVMPAASSSESTSGSSRFLDKTTSSWSSGSRGGRVACPPKCPGVTDSSGLFYTEVCVGYLSPAQCSLLREEDQPNCAYGAGDDCKSCGDNAWCPGGYRMWPKAGYWTASERSGVVYKCPAPSEVRCPGYTGSTEIACGEGYSGSRCTTCKRGYFRDVELCSKCPEGDVMSKLINLILIILFCLVLYGVVAGSVYWAQRRKKKRDQELLWWEAKDMVIWTILVLQTYTLVVNSSTSSGMAAELVQFFRWMNIMNMDFEVMAPECFAEGMSVFWPQYTLFTIVLFAVTAVLLFEPRSLRKCISFLQKHRESVQGKAFTALTTLYTPATLFGVEIVHCIEGTTKEGATAQMSWANSNLVCHGSEHLPAAIMGWFVLFFVTFGYPVFTFVKLLRGLGNASKLQKIQYKKFFGDDFAPKNFWFFHVHFVVMAVLVSTKVVLSAANDMAQIAKLALNSLSILAFMLLLAIKRPYIKTMRWKGPVKQSILLSVLLASMLDYLAFLYVEHKMISRQTVLVLSYVVFCMGLANFLLLLFAFYLVVLRKKSKGHYKGHFLFRSRSRRGISVSTTRTRGRSDRSGYELAKSKASRADTKSESGSCSELVRPAPPLTPPPAHLARIARMRSLSRIRYGHQQSSESDVYAAGELGSAAGTPGSATSFIPASPPALLQRGKPDRGSSLWSAGGSTSGGGNEDTTTMSFQTPIFKRTRSTLDHMWSPGTRHVSLKDDSMATTATSPPRLIRSRSHTRPGAPAGEVVPPLLRSRSRSRIRAGSRLAQVASPTMTRAAPQPDLSSPPPLVRARSESRIVPGQPKPSWGRGYAAVPPFVLPAGAVLPCREDQTGFGQYDSASPLRVHVFPETKRPSSSQNSEHTQDESLHDLASGPPTLIQRAGRGRGARSPVPTLTRTVSQADGFPSDDERRSSSAVLVTPAPVLTRKISQDDGFPSDDERRSSSMAQLGPSPPGLVRPQGRVQALASQWDAKARRGTAGSRPPAPPGRAPPGVSSGRRRRRRRRRNNQKR